MIVPLRLLCEFQGIVQVVILEKREIELRERDAFGGLEEGAQFVEGPQPGGLRLEERSS